MTIRTQYTLASRTVNAGRAAVAWLNAFLASSQDEDRMILYRTLSVEFFPRGVQFIGCDGTMLFRTFVPTTDVEGDVTMPLIEEVPDEAVVVMDVDKFAIAFMRTLVSAASDEASAILPLEMAIEEPELAEPVLGDALRPKVLTLAAFGQRLHCRLIEEKYVGWRHLQYGLRLGEQVDGLTVAPRLFQAVGKLKGVHAIDCAFHGENKAIVIHGRGDCEVRGLLMPMQRHVKKQAKEGAGAEDSL